MTTIFRSHDQAPSLASGPPILGQLTAEWTQLHHLAETADRVAQWARTHPCMAGCARLGDILDTIDTASPADADQILAALLQTHHTDDQLAGRVLLHAMLPALTRRARRCRMPREIDNHEARLQLTITTFWTVIARLGATQNLASRMTLDTVHELTNYQRQASDPWENTDLYDRLDQRQSEHPVQGPTMGLADGPEADDDLAAVLVWARRTGALTGHDAQILADVYATDTRYANHTYAAARAHISIAACRKRAWRARHRLIEAVRDYGNNNQPDAAAASA